MKQVKQKITLQEVKNFVGVILLKGKRTEPVSFLVHWQDCGEFRAAYQSLNQSTFSQAQPQLGMCIQWSPGNLL